MSDLAVLAGLDPRAVASLDEDEFHAMIRAVRERERAHAWTSVNEGIAACAEALWIIIARLNAGVPTVQVKRLGKPKDPGSYPRPDWINAGKPREVVFTSVADAIRMMRR